MKICAFLTLLLMGFINICSASPIKKIESPNAPASLGAYSQALVIDLETTKNLVFVSGQVPINPKTGKMDEDNIHSATNQTLDNIEAILKSAGSDWKYVVRMDVFLQHFDRDWDGMNEEYSKRFPGGVFPVRQTVGVKMDDNTLVEISCIAIVPKKTKK
jgi:2-iminobutanoate/2-iminopropanoate deaminase